LAEAAGKILPQWAAPGDFFLQYELWKIPKCTKDNARKAIKMGITRKTNQRLSENQVSQSSPAKISRHGGPRLGSGRKPGSRNKPNLDHLYEPCAATLAKAMDGKPVFLFIAAMQALEAPMDDVREALGLSREQFLREYGGFITASADMHRRGAAAFFADKK
jgi:hypothetical protein